MEEGFKKLTDDGWERTGEGCRKDPLLKRGNERIFYDIENDRITTKYIFNEKEN